MKDLSMMTSSTASTAAEGFFNSRDQHRRNISRIPEYTDAFTLDYSHLYIFHPEFAEQILGNPRVGLDKFLAIVQHRLRARGVVAPKVRVEVVNLPHSTKIRDVDHRHIGKLVQVEGVVTQSSKPEQTIVRAVYKCLGCGAEMVVDQQGPFTRYPSPCGCKGGECIFMPERSDYTARQYIMVQESSEDIPSGKLPRDIPCELDEGLIESAVPGSRSVIVGSVMARRRKFRDPNPVVYLYLEVNSIRSKEQRRTDVEITPEDIEQFKEMASEVGHLQRIAASVAPSLYGLEEIKQAITLQLCEGTTRYIHGDRRRGQIHMLLTGDAGEGKSAILESAFKLHPRSIKTTGRGSTAVGLTASVHQEDGRWILKAGAMVLADRGLLVADEFTRMNNEDRDLMHPAMAQGNIGLNKAGINAVLNTRCSVLAACNPTGGRWDMYKNLIENLKALPPPLINRFDLIFVLRSDRVVEEEMKRAEYIADLYTHPETTAPPVDKNILRKFFSYARTFKPRISNKARAHLTAYYEKMYRAGMETDSIMITPRQLEGLFRLSEASAKLHLRDTVTEEDAENAVSLVHKSLQQAGVDPATGEIDVEMLITGIPKSLRDKMTRLVEVVGSLSLGNVEGRWVSSEMLYDWLIEHWKIKHGEIDKLLELGVREGVLWQPGTTGDRWAVT